MGELVYFDKEYISTTTYATFMQGYPYTNGNSANGTYLVVKTDMDCFIYIVSMRENIVSGVGRNAYDIKKYYESDKQVYKDKVYIKGGIETMIPVSSSDWGSGEEYRIYVCLEYGSNLSEYRQVNYTSKKYVFDLWARRIRFLSDRRTNVYGVRFYSDMAAYLHLFQ